MKLDQEDIDAIAKATTRRVQRMVSKLIMIGVVAYLVIKFFELLAQ